MHEANREDGESRAVIPGFSSFSIVAHSVHMLLLLMMMMMMMAVVVALLVLLLWPPSPLPLSVPPPSPLL